MARVTRFYRDYPEFNRLSDNECERLAILASVKRGDAAWVIPLFAGLVAAGAALAIGWLVRVLIVTMAAPNGPTRGANAPPALPAPGAPPALAPAASPTALLERVLLAGNLLVCAAALIALYVFVRRVLLVRTMKRLAVKAACPFCEFSLVGLEEQRGAVRCPECGERVVLHEHRIKSEDLIPDTPEGRRAFYAKAREFGADQYGAYAGPRAEGKPTATPRGRHGEQWADLKERLGRSRGERD